MKLHDQDKFLKAFNLLVNNFPRHAEGIRKLLITPEQIFKMLNLIEFQCLEPTEIEYLFTEIIRSPEIDLADILISSGKDLSSYYQIENIPDSFWEESRSNEFGDFNEAKSSFFRVKWILAKRVISDLEFPTAALGYRSYREAADLVTRNLEMVMNYWGKRRRMQSKEQSPVKKAAQSPHDAVILKAEYELENFVSHHPIEENDFDEIDAEREVLREEMSEYNDSASRSHSDGWFYKD